MTVQSRFEKWIADDSTEAALVFRQELLPVEGRDAVFFPPTYAAESKNDKSGYNIDEFSDGRNVCQIDSVGSQANRMEPIFKRSPYAELVPQYRIQADDTVIHLLDAGHRAADAIARFSDLFPKIHEAFLALRDSGDAAPLARIAPTSLVFGVWDSRGTQVKVPRIVRSVIRAFNVRKLTRSAQYSTIAGEILSEGEAEITTKGANAELGLAHVPATQTHGGVQLLEDGSIVRQAILNLTALRALAADHDNGTKALRRYVLGLALVSITAPLPPNLREGCELVPDPESPAAWELVDYNGERQPFDISHDEALRYAQNAAEAFGVEQPSDVFTFNKTIANKVAQMSSKEYKQLLRNGPVTEEAIASLTKKKANNKKKKKKSEAS